MSMFKELYTEIKKFLGNLHSTLVQGPIEIILNTNIKTTAR